MDFKTKKIRKNIPQKTPSPKLETEFLPAKIKRIKKAHIGLLTSFLIVVILLVAIVKTVSSIDFKVFLKAAGADLQQDAYGHSNFLILGTGGKNHDGSDLTDSIIVASLDQENKLITMISIPRDLYIKDPTVGNSKINEIYFNAKNKFASSSEGISYLKAKIEDLTGLPIHYWLKIDFNGFKELVDAIGGIDINVEKSLYDPYYPKDGTYLYETFSISAGQQHLDGETALKYARSRETTSDFDRAKRQQQIIYAMKQKALQSDTLLSKEKISEILNTLKKNIDTNIKVEEILTLGAIAPDYSPDQISHRLIHDDPTQCGGFLYTPSRQFYGGMFVLLPAGGFETLKQYFNLSLNLPQIAAEKAKIQILNGTKKNGAAGETKQILKRFCLDIVRFGNANTKDIAQTTYYYKTKVDENGKAITKRPATLDFLEMLIPGQESTNIPQEYLEAGYMNDTDIIIELGNDYTGSDKYVNDPFYSLPAILPTPTTTPAATPSAETESASTTPPSPSE